MAYSHQKCDYCDKLFSIYLIGCIYFMWIIFLLVAVGVHTPAMLFTIQCKTRKRSVSQQKVNNEKNGKDKVL